MEQFLFKSETFFRLWGKRWGSRRASSLWARRRTMGNRSKWRVPELPIASPRKLLFDIHTGSRKKGQRKMWGLNGQQTNSGVWGVTLLNCEMKWCSRAETNTDQLWKMDIRRRKNWKVLSCLFVPWLQQKFPPALGFLIWFSSKIEMVNYVDVYYYKLLQHFCSILRPSHLPSLIPTIPNAQHKERQLDKTFVFFPVSPTTDWTQNTNCDSFPIALIHPPSYYTNKDTLLCLNFWGNMKSAIWENFAEFVPEVSVQPPPRSQPLAS